MPRNSVALPVGPTINSDGFAGSTNRAQPNLATLVLDLSIVPPIVLVPPFATCAGIPGVTPFPKKEEPEADGCGEGDKAPDTPKVEDSAPSSLPQYTQSLGTIEKGYSLDDVFARLKGGK